MPSSIYACRVCGWGQAQPPWGETGKFPTHDICDCCGVEFGYEDSTPASGRQYRQVWVEGGCQWFDPSARPAAWSCEEQAKNIPSEFR